jgi:hypothetical protein
MRKEARNVSFYVVVAASRLFGYTGTFAQSIAEEANKKQQSAQSRALFNLQTYFLHSLSGSIAQTNASNCA